MGWLVTLVVGQGVETASNISDLLQSSGGWGLSGILFVLLGFVVKDNLKQRDLRSEQLQEQHEQLFVAMEKRIETDIKYEQTLAAQTKQLEKLVEKSA